MKSIAQHAVEAWRHLVLLVLAMLLSGCLFTEELFGPRKYDVELSNVMVARDSGDLVVLAGDFVYVLDRPALLRDAMSSQLRDRLWARFGDFKVSPDNEIKGEIVLGVRRENLSEAEIAIARAIGLEEKQGFFGQSLVLQGEQYLANGITPPSSNYSLNRHYRVTVYDSLSKNERLKRLPAAPLALAADGALVALALPVAVAGGTVWIVLSCAPSLLFEGDCDLR